MRILRLDLERYGPFVGQTLDLGRAARLHVVHGPNEAGKTSALAAITDLLFGIEARTPYAFRHEGKDLRIGATLERQDGARLAVRRRKGNKNTLVDKDENPLRDDVLLPFLGGVTREVFRQAFGLDTLTLRQGAEEMLKAGGEVGASLFAAAFGLRGLNDLRKKLEGEADGIFAPRAAKDRRFYQALERFELARKSIRDRELKAGTWKELNEEIAELEARLEQIKEDRTKKGVERGRLARLRQVAPLVRQIDADLEEWAVLARLPEVPAGFSAELTEALSALAGLDRERDQAVAGVEEAERRLAEIAVDDALLARGDEIQGLFAESTAYAKNRADTPRIQEEEGEFTTRLAKLARRLGVEASGPLELAPPADAAVALARELSAEGEAIERELAAGERSLAAEKAELAKIDRQRAERGALLDPRPLAERLAAFAPVLQRLDRGEEARLALAEEERLLAVGKRSLAPPLPEGASLARATAIPAEAVARFRREMEGAAERSRHAAENVEAAALRGAASEDKLFRLSQGGRPVPTVGAVLAAREARERAWAELRAPLLAGEAPAAPGRRAAAVADFERHSSEADRLADEMMTDAERVASYAIEKRGLEAERRREVEARSRWAAALLEQATLAEEWRALWAPAGVVPSPPAEMEVWLSGAKALLDREARVAALRAEVDRSDRAAAELEPALTELAEEAALPPQRGLGPALLARRVEERLRVLKGSWDEARDLETSARDIRARIDALHREHGRVVARREAWGPRWREAVAALRLPATATLPEARAALQAWSEVPDVVQQRDNRARRVGGMKREMEAFETRVRSLAGELAPDLLESAPDRAVKELQARLSAARGEGVRRDQARLAVRRAGEGVAEAAARRQKAEAEVAALKDRLPGGEAAPDLIAALSRREELARILAERRSQLNVRGEGVSEELIRADLAGFEVDHAAAKLEELATDEERLEQAGRDVYAELELKRRERRELEGGMGAEVALQLRRNAETDLAGSAHDWAVLKIAGLLLAKTMERQRASQRDPLMARASLLFSRLTGGSFGILDQELGEDDVPRLIGRRGDGEQVAVAGMSEGTRDQLYLALRLAYLEDYATRSEPMPFIGDDLFTSFDEDRTAQGLASLAEIGDRVQTLLFTHHQHVVDIARSTLGDGVSVLKLSA